LDIIAVVFLVMRIYPLVALLGMSAFFVVILDRSMIDFSPAQRSFILRSISPRLLVLMWSFLLISTGGGALYALDAGLLAFSLNITSRTVLLLDLEGLMTMVLILSFAVLTYLVFRGMPDTTMIRIKSPIDQRLDRAAVAQPAPGPGILGRMRFLFWMTLLVSAAMAILGVLVSAS